MKLLMGIVVLALYFCPKIIWATCGQTQPGNWYGGCEALGACTPTSPYTCQQTQCSVFVNGQPTTITKATFCSPLSCATIDQGTINQCLAERNTGGGGGGIHNCDPSSGDCSPIVLDVSGHGFVLTNAASGVMFDIDGSGHPLQIAWTAEGSDNAFLALPGSDGEVHNGQQLFGNFTPQPASDSPNGFAALAVYDANGDGVIDAKDPIWPRLRLWIDADHNGIAQTSELHALPSMGVTSLSLHYKESDKTDQYGNRFRYRALVDPETHRPISDGRIMYDVFFVGEGGN